MMNKRNWQGLILLLLVFALGGLTSLVLSEELTGGDVQSAAKVAGLSFTDSEIELMLPDLENAREDYAANREHEIDNGLAPALVFNPILPGIEIPDEQEEIRYSEPGQVTLPADRNELAWMTVRELAELIRSKQITSVELTEFFLDRLRTYDDTLHCVVTLTEERALAAARRADAEIARGQYRGLLHGIPYGAKDLLAAKGYPTTWGATPYKEQTIDMDATVIERLDEAGAVLVAKLTLGALAWGDVWFGGRTRNPWNAATGSSGSSAGSASAISAGLVPFAIGTETLGSIVSPSTVCGVTGLRPTFGRVSRHGAMALSWTMDKIGPIARSAEDCAIVFAAIHGPDGRDFHMYDAPFNYDGAADPTTIKVGYLKSAFENNYGFKAQDSISLQVLRNLGYELVPVELPEAPELGIILSAEAAAAFDELTRSNRDDELVRQQRRAWPNTFRAGRLIPAVEYIQANRLRTQLCMDMEDVFEQIDVYVHPSWSSTSLGITNHTGHPAVVVPNGFRQNGLPTSITFTAGLFEEGKALRVAKAFQDATDWDEQHPPLTQ
jgi:Asp-tRNA(Asn)/Glu-tRNA(Gln) amidotransferase A subunit family amidase